MVRPFRRKWGLASLPCLDIFPKLCAKSSLEGRRRVAVTERRTKVDWAGQMKQLVDEDYPDKDRIVLVMDNPVSWYGAGFEHPSPGLAVRGV